MWVVLAIKILKINVGLWFTLNKIQGFYKNGKYTVLYIIYVL